MQALNQVFSMYNRPKSDTSQSDAYAQRYFEQKKKEEEAKRLQEQREKQGQLLGDIARKKLGVDTDFMAINDDPAMNTQMYDPSMFDYDMDEFAPNDFELAVMHDEANNEEMDTMDYYSPKEIQDMETADLYQQMATAGYGEQALDQLFPSSRGDRLSRIQGINKERASYNSKIASLQGKYNQAKDSNDIEAMDMIKAQADALNEEYMALSPVGTQQNAPAYKQMMGSARDFAKFTQASSVADAQENVDEAYFKLLEGGMSQEDYRKIVQANNSKAIRFGGKVIDPNAKFGKEDREVAGEIRAQDNFADAQINEPVKIWKQDKVNQDAINRMLHIDNLKKFVPQAKAGNPQAIKNLLAGVSRLGSNEALSNEEFKLLLSGNFGDKFEQAWNEAFGSGSKVGATDVENAVNTINSYAEPTTRRFNQAVKSGISIIRKDAGKYANNYSDEDLRNKLVSNLRSSGVKGKPNPADFTSLGAFRKAGGNAKDWFAYMKNKKG